MSYRIGAPGFEPGTFWSQTRRATGLRYAPRCLMTQQCTGVFPYLQLDQSLYSSPNFSGDHSTSSRSTREMIRKLPSGNYRLYSLRKDPRTGKRRNLGTFPTRAAAEKHEREVEFFKRRSREGAA